MNEKKVNVYATTLEEAKDKIQKTIDTISNTFDWSSTKKGLSYWSTVIENLKEVQSNVVLLTREIKINEITYENLNILASKLNIKSVNEVIDYIANFYIEEHS